MILDEIIAHKRLELAARKSVLPESMLRAKATGAKKRAFAAALRAGSSALPVIAEVKRRSPSKGALRENFDAAEVARSYERGGAAALSVLTDQKFFGGSLTDLEAVRLAVKLPILRKDFTLEEYDLLEARLHGADAVLLIAGVLSGAEIGKLTAAASALGLDALVEVHSEEELAAVRPFKPGLIGINNRDLKTFDVDLETTRRLAAKVDWDALVVAESGIRNRQDLLYLKTCGAKAALVGETLLREPNPGAALKRLIEG